MSETSRAGPIEKLMRAKVTRRNALKLGGIATGAAVIGATGGTIDALIHNSHSSKSAENGVGGMTGQLPETASGESAPPLFADEMAERFAQELGITPGIFFSPGENLPDTYSAYNSDELLPIFHPHVIAQKHLIYDLSEKYDIPSNVIATLMAISSGGDPRAVQRADRNTEGLFQFNRGLHQQVVFDAANEGDIHEISEDDLAMMALKKCVDAAEDYHSSTDGRAYKGWEPKIYLRALGMYQSGIENTQEAFDHLPMDARWMMLNAKNLFTIGEVAQKMREENTKNHMTDIESNKDIVIKLRSDEVDARSSAYNVEQAMFSSTDEALKYLSSPILETPLDNNELPVDSNTAEANMSNESSAKSDAYNAYMRYKELRDYDKYVYPLNPALRVLIATSDSTLSVEGDEVNQITETQNNWFNLDTSMNNLRDQLSD